VSNTHKNVRYDTDYSEFNVDSGLKNWVKNTH